MTKPYDLLNGVLNTIEDGLRYGINPDTLAENCNLSTRQLERIFKYAFNTNIGSYIRSRKLTSSLNNLLKTDEKIFSIAVEYGFEFEQSYIRSFKREFGITPGELRKTKQIIKVKPPLYLFDENKIGDSLLFGPDIVIVPEFHVIGKPCKLPNDRLSVQKAGIHFWENERQLINNVINPNLFFGITNNLSNSEGQAFFLPSLQVSKTDSVPENFIAYTFKTTLCARFRYIGQYYHYTDFNSSIVEALDNAIEKFSINEQINYTLSFDTAYFRKINVDQYNTFCQIEWFAPVIEKN